MPYILVGVPVEAGLFEDKPVLPPLLSEVAFGILLLPQPALTVAVAQVLTRDSPSTGTSEGTCRERKQKQKLIFWAFVGVVTIINKCGHVFIDSSRIHWIQMNGISRNQKQQQCELLSSFKLNEIQHICNIDENLVLHQWFIMKIIKRKQSII